MSADDPYGLQALTGSIAMISLWHPSMADTENRDADNLACLMQLGLTVAQGKPLIVIHRPGDVVPAKMALIADAVIEMSLEDKDWEKPLTEALLKAGFTTDALEEYKHTGVLKKT